MDIIFLVSVIIFVVVILAAVLIYLLITSKVKGRALKARIGNLSTSSVSVDTNKISVKSGFLKQWFIKTSDFFAKSMKPEKAGEVSALRTKLLHSGYRDKKAAVIFTQIRIMCVLAPLACFFFWNLFSSSNFTSLNLMVFYICLALIGYSLPTIWLTFKTAKRQQKMLNGFPDAVDMLVVCVEAGMGMDAAMERVGREIEFENDALGDELKLYNKEMRVGKTRRQALKDLALRTGLEDMRALSTLLIQTDKFGTSIAKALKTHSEFLRVQRYQRAEEKAAKLTVKLVIPLIFCMFPAVFIVILGPAIINAIRINQ